MTAEMTPVPRVRTALNHEEPDRVLERLGTDLRYVAGVRERAQLLNDSTNYFITARMVTSHGPHMTACNLRGIEQFLLDMSLNPEFATVLVECYEPG